jgi:hypothetical protein
MTSWAQWEHSWSQTNQCNLLSKQQLGTFVRFIEYLNSSTDKIIHIRIDCAWTFTTPAGEIDLFYGPIDRPDTSENRHYFVGDIPICLTKANMMDLNCTSFMIGYMINALQTCIASGCIISIYHRPETEPFWAHVKGIVDHTSDGLSLCMVTQTPPLGYIEWIRQTLFFDFYQDDQYYYKIRRTVLSDKSTETHAVNTDQYSHHNMAFDSRFDTLLHLDLYHTANMSRRITSNQSRLPKSLPVFCGPDSLLDFTPNTPTTSIYQIRRDGYLFMDQMDLREFTKEQIESIKNQLTDFTKDLINQKYFAMIINIGCVMINEDGQVLYHSLEHLYPIYMEAKIHTQNMQRQIDSMFQTKYHSVHIPKTLGTEGLQLIQLGKSIAFFRTSYGRIVVQTKQPLQLDYQAKHLEIQVSYHNPFIFDSPVCQLEPVIYHFYVLEHCGHIPLVTYCYMFPNHQKQVLHSLVCKISQQVEREQYPILDLDFILVDPEDLVRYEGIEVLSHRIAVFEVEFNVHWIKPPLQASNRSWDQMLEPISQRFGFKNKDELLTYLFIS